MTRKDDADQRFRRELQAEAERRAPMQTAEFPISEVAGLVRRRKFLRYVRGGALSIALLVTSVFSLSAIRSPATPSRTRDVAQRPGQASGELLMQVGNKVMAFTSKGVGRVLHDSELLWTANPDGTYVTSSLGADGQIHSLTVHDGGEPQGVQMPQGRVEESLLSPDGTMIGIIVDVRIEDDSAPQRKLCVSSVQGDDSECFTLGVSPWLFDWSPDSSSLVVAGDEGEGMVIVDLATESSRELIRRSDVPLTQGDKPAGIQFFNPEWSPSGEYVSSFAGWSSAGPNGPSYSMIPLIVDLQGTLIAEGEVRPNYSDNAWAPDRDVVAYSTVSSEDGSFEVSALDPGSRKGTHLFDGKTDPSKDFAERLVTIQWSPDGSFLAATAGQLVSIVSTRGQEESRSEFRTGESGRLVGWVQ